MALGLTPKEIISSGKHPLLECSKEWERVELHEIAEVQNGFAFKSEYFNHESGLPFIRIRDVGKSKAEELYSGDYDDDYLVNKGDILIGMDGDFRAAYWIGEPGLLNQRVCRIRNIDDSYSKKFLYYLLQPYLDAIHAETSAVTVKHLSSRTIQTIPLPNPPLPTQNRIVEKIEELFSELDNGVENLKKAQQQLRTYRQAVLKDAFEGKLTKKWREQQDDLPTPEELLHQIKAERKAHRQRELAEWEKEVEQWEKDWKGRKPRKPRKAKDLNPIKQKEFDKLSNLPSDWVWIKFGEIFEDSPQNGLYKPKSDYGSGHEIVRIDNFYDGKMSGGLKQVNLSEDEISKYRIKTNNLLINRVNSLPYLGKCGLVTDKYSDSVFESNVMKIELNEKIVVPKLLAYYLSSQAGTTQIRKNAKHAVNQASINQTDVANTFIPMTSVHEQKQILNEIESRLSVVDQLEQIINENLQKAEALRQSILKKAFSGELVEE